MINNIINFINSYNNIAILGYGREGKSTYKLIRKYLKNKKLTILDGNEKLLDNNEELNNDDNLEFVLGSNYLNNLDNYDLIIKSPGVNFKYIEYEHLRNKITSQIDMFFKYSNCYTIGVTGTKGKSTTSSLIYHILNSMGKNTVLVGNIGIPVFDEIENMTEDMIVVVELSCHQLQFVKSSPNIGILLNIYEEHLDLYKSYLDYQLAKLNIFKYQKENDYQIYGIDSLDSYKYYLESKNGVGTFAISNNINKIINGILIDDNGLSIKNDNQIQLIYEKSRPRNLIGDHNLYNIAVSLLVGNILNLDLSKVCDYIDTFQPLEHRMEKVGTFNDITFYNDSIATIPSATINCIKSIDNLETVIIGGMDRKVDLSSLVDYLFDCEKINTIICLKDTGYQIADKLLEKECNKKIFKVKDMDEAVQIAYKNTSRNKSCVLSPSAASYNTYKNFEERGKDYKNLIIKYSK